MLGDVELVTGEIELAAAWCISAICKYTWSMVVKARAAEDQLLFGSLCVRAQARENKAGCQMPFSEIAMQEW